MTELLQPEAPALSIDFRDPSLYLNRELSWLQFNRRVLHEALDARTPLLERLKFLAIFSSNLDEFFQVRVAGLKQQVAAGIVERTADGMTPEDQLSAISRIVRDLARQHHHCLSHEVLPALAAHGPHAGRGHRRPRRRRPGARGWLLPGQRLSGADAARRRSRPPLPVHLQPEPVARGGAARRRRRGAVRAGQGPEDPAPLGSPPEPAPVRAARAGDRRQPGGAVSGRGDPGLVHLPDHPQHRPADRQRRRSGRPAQPDSGGGAEPAVRRGRADRGPCLDAGVAPRPAADGVQRAAGPAHASADHRRPLRGRGPAGHGRPADARVARPAGAQGPASSIPSRRRGSPPPATSST